MVTRLNVNPRLSLDNDDYKRSPRLVKKVTINEEPQGPTPKRVTTSDNDSGFDEPRGIRRVNIQREATSPRHSPRLTPKMRSETLFDEPSTMFGRLSPDLHQRRLFDEFGRPAPMASDWEREMERMQKQFFRDFDHHRPPLQTTHSLPETFHHHFPSSRPPMMPQANVMAPPPQEEGTKESYIADKDGNPRYVGRLNMGDVKPEELYISTSGRTVSLDVKQEFMEGNSTVTRKYTRSINLPENVDPKLLDASLEPDGTLILEAPVIVPEYQKHRDQSFTTEWPVVSDPETHQRKIRQELPLQDYKPDDIHVKTVDGKVVVTAEKEEIVGGATVRKEYHKAFDIPENVDPFSVTAFVTSEGTLVMEAPLNLIKSSPLS